METEVIEKIDYKLNSKQLLFADAIAKGKTNLEAFDIAGYKAKNINVKYVSSFKLVNNVKIQHYVDLQRKKQELTLQKKYDLTQETLVNDYNVIVYNLQIIIDDVDTDKRTKVAALKAQKDTKDSLTRIAGLFNDKLQVSKDVQDVTKEDSITLARIAKGEVMTSQAN